jgi:hypothetical protein
MLDWQNYGRRTENYDENNTLFSIIVEKVTFLFAAGITLLLICMTFFWS